MLAETGASDRQPDTAKAAKVAKFHTSPETATPRDISAVGDIRSKQSMDNVAEQDALFEIDGPDEDGCVWICSTAGRDDWY